MRQQIKTFILPLLNLILILNLILVPLPLFAGGTPKSFQQKIECAQHLQFYFNGDENVYSGLEPEPFFLFLPNATGLQKPLYISASKTGYMTSPKIWEKGFKMNGGCVNPLDWSWDELTSRRRKLSCPATEISRGFEPKFEEFLTAQILGRVKMVSQQLKEDLLRNKSPGDRSIAQDNEANIVRLHADRLKKCDPLLTEAADKFIRDAIRQEISELKP